MCAETGVSCCERNSVLQAVHGNSEDVGIELLNMSFTRFRGCLDGISTLSQVGSHITTLLIVAQVNITVEVI